MTPEAWRLLEVVRQAESPSELEMRRMRRAARSRVWTVFSLVSVTSAISRPFICSRSCRMKTSRCSSGMRSRIS